MQPLERAKHDHVPPTSPEQKQELSRRIILAGLERARLAESAPQNLPVFVYNSSQTPISRLEANPLLSRYVGEQRPEDRDKPVAFFSGNGA